MQISIEIVLIFSILLLSLAGFILASFVYSKKNKKKKLICPLRTDCNKVIHSKYSTFGPFPVEVLGMMYYFSTIFIYLYINCSDSWFLGVKYGVFIFSCLSVMFSLYLIGIQMFIIKKWCSWCVMSAIISMLIFLLSYLHLFI